MTQEALKLALETLVAYRREHHYCEDKWYSCPKHEDGCANEREGDECNCGADEINAEFDKAITAIKEALAQTQEPVAWQFFEGGKWHNGMEVNDHRKHTEAAGVPVRDLYITPPQRTEQEPDDIASILACRDMLDAQPVPPRTEQEPVIWSDYESNGMHHKPVAWMDADGNVSDNNDHKCFPIPLYTQPPQRTWVGLTDEEVSEVFGGDIHAEHSGELRFVRAIEAKLKELNT